MEYTVQKLAQMAGVSGRTLRYYDQIGLLHPARVNSAGYRIYGGKEVDRLQQILFYRELEIALPDIAEILGAPDFDELSALRRHRTALWGKRAQLDELLSNLEKTIQAKERGMKMNDKEKFEGFKQKLVEENEREYGAEVREKYGGRTVDESNRKMMNLTQEEYAVMQEKSERILALLDVAFGGGDPAGETAQEAARLHKEWLGFTWPQYTPEAHAGLAEMYVADRRFAKYYDRGTEGKTEFFRDAIKIFTKQA